MPSEPIIINDPAALLAEDLVFEELSTPELLRLASTWDPYLVGPALGELRAREAPEALPVAWGLLRGRLDDPYVKITALDTLLQSEPDQALSFLEQHLDEQEAAFLKGAAEVIDDRRAAIPAATLERLMRGIRSRIGAAP